MNLSISINKLLSILPVISLVVFAAYKIFNIFAMAVSQILTRKFPVILDIVPKHLQRIITINKFFLIFIWLMLLANSFQIDRGLVSVINEISEYNIIINDYNITLGDFISFILIVGITLYLTQIVSKFFENDKVKSKGKTPRGFFAATSLSIRIIVVFVGLTFSMAKLGVDLSKFSMIAGALGVGIGFGLQDIVNNFISGMILIYGRPIQVGDTVEVDSLLGVVKHIGIRSSVLTTYYGAEVLVPNSTLISNKLTNWTLSDNKKRVEIFLGVEYGADLEEVIEIMLEATKGVDLILRNPAPQALFMEFGDSSLNFRLRFWVSYEDGYTAKSDVSIAIYKMLAQKNITIPFPQLDVHHFHDTEDEEMV